MKKTDKKISIMIEAAAPPAINIEYPITSYSSVKYSNEKLTEKDANPANKME